MLSAISEGLTKFARAMNVSPPSVLGDVPTAVRTIRDTLESPTEVPSPRKIRDTILLLLVARRKERKEQVKP